MRFWKGLVIVCVVLLLCPLLIKGIQQAREYSRLWQCQAHLRDFGVGLMKFSQQDPQTRYCTGAYDWAIDGCPDSVGWVADLVNSGYCRPGEMLCPANPIHGIEKLMQLYLRNSGADEDGYPRQDITETGICGAKPNVWGQACTPERQIAIEQHILDLGYNTNYSASWYLVRGELKLTVWTEKDYLGKITRLELHAVQPGFAKWQGLACTRGPLRRDDVEKSKIPSGQIPLLGDAAPGDPSRAIAAVNLHQRGQVFILEGDRLAESYGRGPAVYKHGTDRLDSLFYAESLGNALFQGDGWSWEWTSVIFEKKNDDPQSTGYWGPALQDTRNWFCHHGPISCSPMAACEVYAMAMGIAC
jgi:hypothetical protein